MPRLSRRAAAAALLGLAACHPATSARPSPDPIADAEAAARAAVAGEQALGANSLADGTLGVAPLAVSAGDTALAALGYGLADLLVTDLSRSARLQVVDRIRMDALLREVRLAEAGRVDSATAPRVGRLVAARQLLLGALSELPGGQLRIDARIADVATGELR